MDTNNWRLAQGGEPLTDTGDWRSQLQTDSRQAIVNKIMETLKRHIPVPGEELKEIAVRFEEKIFTAATSESEYQRKISLKMLAMDTKSQNPISNLLQSNSANGQNQPNLASQSMQSLLNSQGTPLPVPGPTNQSQAGQQQDVPEQQQQDVPQQRQQDVPQQQQQLSQNPQQYLYQQHLKNQLMKQKFQQGSISHSQMQSHIQQQQQQNLIRKNQLQSSQQSVLQPSMMQSSQLSSLQQKQLFQSQSAMPGASSSVMDTMDSGDWRHRLQVDSRQRIVNKIMETLKRHLPFSGPEGLQELEKIAVRFEEKIYTAATSQSDYLRKISLKMLTMETKNPMPNSLQSNFLTDGLNLPDPVASQNQLVADLQCKLVNWIDNLGCER